MAYYALKKDVFDKSKITVVGSPTITSDGVLIVNGSNSRYNYCKFDVNLFSATAPFKIEIPIKVTKLPNADALYFYVGSAIEVVITSSGELKVRLRSGTSDTYWDIALNQPIIPASVGLNQENLLGVIQYTGSEYRLGYKLNNIFTLVTTIQKNIKILEANFGHIGWNSTLEPEYTAFADLTKFKIYVDNQLVFQPVKPAYLLERRKPMVWDKEQFTVVGSPSISESGVASGFSASNYIRVPYISLSQNFKIFTPKFNSTNVSQQQKIVRYSDGNIRIEIYNSKIRLFRYTANNVYDLPTGKTILQNNTDYYYYVEQTTNGTNYYLKGYISTDGINWALDIDKTFSTAMYDYSNSAPIQISGADATQPFLGTLNLKQFKIYTDNNLVFDGGAETYVYDPSKFTVVGSPTITEYGVASGFGAGKYINTTTLAPNTKPWSIIVPIITGSSTTGSNQTFLCRNVTSGVEAKLDVNGKFVCFLSSDGSNPDIAYGLASSYIALPNTKYYFRLSYDGAKYEMAYSFDKENFTVIASKQSDLTIKNGLDILLGDNAVGASYPFLGSIDLTQFSITVDGKEVFTGAKEQFYMCKK